jgi:alpha-galactosidase
MPLLRLEGLAADATYSVTTINDKLKEQTDKLSGAYLMHHGIQLRLRGDYDAAAIKFDRVR